MKKSVQVAKSNSNPNNNSDSAMQSKMQNEQWFKRNEKASMFWLNVTIILVRYLPRFALNIAVIFVTFIYFMFSKNERRNLKKFYALAQNYYPKNKQMPKMLKNPKIYLHFYHFGWAICDKVAAWIGKIEYKDLAIKDKDFIIKELCCGERGQVLVMSHFGNVDMANAMTKYFQNMKITTFVYQKNSQDFIKMLTKISKGKISQIFVDDIDVAKLLELKAIVDNGGHIAIMGDRVAINSKRNMMMKFFGKDCIFPYGAFIIAYLLKVRVSSLWCEKIDGKYVIELENLANHWHTDNNRDAVIKPILERYVTSLENHALNNPVQWFSFYDFWGSVESQTNTNNLKGDLCER